MDTTRSPTAEAQDTTKLFNVEPIGVTDWATGIKGSEVKQSAWSLESYDTKDMRLRNVHLEAIEQFDL